MKRRCTLITLISLLLISCDNGVDTPAPETSTISQPIINGHLAVNEPQTVTLMTVSGDESVMDYYSLCPASGQRECRNKYPNDDVACLMDYSGTWCPYKCSNPGATGYVCYDDDEGDYSYLYPFRCVDYDGTYVWTSDYFDGPSIICEAGCNANGTGCDAYGINQHRACPDGYSCSDSSKLCLFNIDEYKCVSKCSSPGSVTHSCDCYSYDYGSICYESTYRCTEVQYNGTTQYANLFVSESMCTWGCNGNVCTDYASTVPYTPVVGGVTGDAFCSGTLIHPQWVLTAAHCIVDSDDSTKFSKKVLKTRIGIGTDTRSILSFKPDEFNHFYYHEKYKNTGNEGDIALIRLSEPVPSNIAMPALPLPPWLAFTSADLPLNMRTSGFGYDENGMTDRRLTVDLPTTGYCGIYNPYDGDECSMGTISYSGCHPSPALCAYSGPADERNKRITIPSGTIYAPIQEQGQCSGDSGGPTYYEVGGVEYVAGVTSYGDAQCRGYNVATAVADYYDWIIDIAPEIALQYHEICGNGVDDDGNGLVDNNDSACNLCGNYRLDAGEVCDGNLFAIGSQSCRAWSSNFASGNLQCNHCELDFSGCKPVAAATCGNGALDNGETCDGNLFAGGKTACSAWDEKYSSGSVTCRNCAVDYSNCVEAPACGNHVLDNGEACDGSLFAGGKTTCSAWDGKYLSGNVSCNRCMIDYTNCVEKPACGNGILDNGETCDGNLFAGGITACRSWDEQYRSGSVSCNTCAIDYTNCVAEPACGNGILDNNESCDGNLFAGGKTACSAWNPKYMSGVVSCHECAIDESNCVERPYCGNGILDDGEVCDGNLFADEKITCSAWDDQYVSGMVSCNTGCTLSFSECRKKPAVCGNGSLEDEEVCDGELFKGGKTSCSAWSTTYDSGKVTCDDCAIDYSNCTVKPHCGNGVLDSEEACDDNLFAGGKTTCSAWDSKYSSGTVSCDNCTVDYSNCVEKPACGNGILDNGEVCDDKLFAGGNTACSAWNEKYSSGSVSCQNCSIVYYNCVMPPACGNGVLDNNESCDGTLFAGGKTTCKAWNSQYISGIVSCNADCSLNVSNCEKDHSSLCGNGLLDSGEVCDGILFADGKTACSAWDDKYGSGSVLCDNCSIDYSDCVEKPACGNGILDNGEACDGSRFANGKTTCREWDPKYQSGNVTCNNCAVDYSQCVEMPSCGNGILDNGEVCDGSLFVDGKVLCNAWDKDYISGDVGCTSKCAIDYSKCVGKATCGNGVLDNGESCDGNLFAGGKTACSMWDRKYASGDVTCDNCVVDYSQCVEKPSCGNGILDNGEPCDGSLFVDGKVMCSEWDEKYISGDVTCTNNCVINYSKCVGKATCGNGILDNGEACDGDLFAGGKTSCNMWDHKYVSGDITCDNCVVDYSQCVEKAKCGNGILDNGEPCDGSLFVDGKVMCSAWDEKYISGEVSCTRSCTINDSNCVERPSCGNGILDDDEKCDGTRFRGGKTSCSDWDEKYVSGDVTCNQCDIDYSMCEEPNNGTVESGCAASPLRNSQSPMTVLVLLCIGALLRRRTSHWEE